MFSSVNLLFLLSLAIISWIILCYFKQIEDQRLIEKIEYNIEEVLEDIPQCRGNYDVYWKFVCISACIFAFSKSITMLEDYIGKSVHDSLYPAPESAANGADAAHDIEELLAEQENLKMQVNYVIEENANLKKIINDLRVRIFAMISEFIRKRINESRSAQPNSKKQSLNRNRTQTIDNLRFEEKTLKMEITELIRAHASHKIESICPKADEENVNIENLRAEQDNLLTQVNNVEEENTKLKQCIKELQQRNSARIVELIATRIHGPNGTQDVKPDAAEELRIEKEDLKKKVRSLENQNESLQQTVKKLEERKLPRHNKPIAAEARIQQHFKTNSLLYPQDHELSLQLETTSEAGDFTKMWKKYVGTNRQALTVSPPKSPTTNLLPLVVSTEELQNIYHGR